MDKSDLLEGDIKKHMVRLALPNIGGMLAIVLFNIIDTFFVSKLGEEPLAAMGFTFPVVMLVGAVSSGISLGAGSILARAFGKKDYHLMSRTATDGMLLSIIFVALVSSLGLLTVTPLFSVLGAEENIIPLISEYMIVWYSGVVFFILPPLSDSCMRAIGDMKRPLYVMLLCATINLILDPLFIFDEIDILGFQIKGLNMGIKGAAIATLMARSCGAFLSLGFVAFKYKLVNFKYKNISELLTSWRNILSIGITGAVIRILPQIIRAFITKVAAIVGGMSAVAAVAAGSRLESFSSIVSMAVGVSLIPIIGQNYGAGKFDRVAKTRKMTLKISIYYTIILTIIAILVSSQLAELFSDNTEVIKYIRVYLIVLMIGSFGLNLYSWVSQCLNAIGKPRVALRINVAGSILLVPSISAGAFIGNFSGMLIGLSVGQIVIGIMAYRIGKKEI